MLDFTQGSMDWDKIEKEVGGEEKKSFRDDKEWKLSRDDNDNGAALIRLLPDPEGNKFKKIFSHTLQAWDNVNKKKIWFIASSPQTVGKECPVSNVWSALYNLGTDASKSESKKFNRKMQFVTNIKVLKDPANPENEGQIKILKMGVKIKDRIVEAMNPSDTNRAMGEQPKEMYNPLYGANVKLKIKKAAGFLNYDDTSIEECSSIYGSPEEAKNDIIENGILLEEYVGADAFESYEALQKRLRYFFKFYEPEFMDKKEFFDLINPIIGNDEQSSTVSVPSNTSKPEETQSTHTEKTAPAPKAEPATVQVQEDDDLSFLDGL